jgi:hypothetical protein
MPRNVTVTFGDGTKHTYQGVPDNVTPDAINARASSEFKQSVTGIDGGRAAAPPPKPKPKPTGIKSILDYGMVDAPTRSPKTDKSFGGALKNAFIGANEMVEGLYNAPGAVVNAAAHPINTFNAAKDAAAKGIDIAKGGIQTVRELSPEDQRGSAPAMDKTAYNEVAKALGDKYGSVQKAWDTTYEDPLGPAITAAQVAVPALRAVGADKLLAETAAKVGAKAARAGSAVKEFNAAPRVVREATADMTGGGTAGLSGLRVDTEAKAAADAAKAAARANRQGTAATASLRRTERQAEALKRAAIPAPDVGVATHVDELGNRVRGPAVEAADRIEAAKVATDRQLRAALDEDTRIQQGSGKGVSDLPETQAVVKESQERIRPDAATRPEFGHALKEGDKRYALHKKVEDTLTPRVLTLDATKAAEARANGFKVTPNGDGTFRRVVKPSFDDVDKLRRELNSVGSSPMEGYNAIDIKEARDLGKKVTGLLDTYSEGMSADVRTSWKAHKDALDAYDRTRAGKMLTGLEKVGDDFNVNPSAIPGRIIAGGREAVKQASELAGREPVEAMVRDHVQNVVSGIDTAKGLESAFAPGTSLGSIVSDMPELERAVADRAAHLRSTEAAAKEAARHGEKAAINEARVPAYGKIADELTGKSAAKAAAARKLETAVADLEGMDPKEVSSKYMKIMGDAREAGDISAAQYVQARELASRQAQAFKNIETKKQWIRSALLVSGGLGGAAGGAAVAGLPGAVGLSAAALAGGHLLTGGKKFIAKAAK